MNYKFDTQGWYDGTTEDAGPMTTPVAPPVLNPGQSANWSGISWIVRKKPELEVKKPVDLVAIEEFIKTERDRRIYGGVKVGDFWFHTDLKTRTQLSILDAKATRSSWPSGVTLHPAWKTIGGVKTPMTVALLRQILDAGIVAEGEIFEAAEDHIVAMRDSTDPENYDYMSGWPLAYGD